MENKYSMYLLEELFTNKRMGYTEKEELVSVLRTYEIVDDLMKKYERGEISFDYLKGSLRHVYDMWRR